MPYAGGRTVGEQAGDKKEGPGVLHCVDTHKTGTYRRLCLQATEQLLASTTHVLCGEAPSFSDQTGPQ